MREARDGHVSPQDTPDAVSYLIHLPSFSWQYLGRNVRPLMEALCWVLGIMTAGLHDAAPGLHPLNGWGNPDAPVDVDLTREGPTKSAQVRARDHEIAVARQQPASRSEDKVVVGVVMEKRSNHSPHRLFQSIVEGVDRRSFCVVVFAQPTRGYPAAARAIFDAADEVVAMPWHPKVEGLPNVAASRKAVAGAKVWP